MYKEWAYHRSKVLKYSHSFVHNCSTELAILSIESHVIEKGITMPERHLGFGKDVIRSVIARCDYIISQWGSEYTEVQSAIANLRQYLEIHNSECFQLPDEILSGINSLLEKQLNISENCYNETKSHYFSKTESPFIGFAYSRHSIRSFAGTPVDENDLESAIALAQTAPSACNRQATRVKVIKTEEKKKFLASFQRGNRGFGDKADKWILITSEISCWPHNNLFNPYLDAGIFTMNLLYALHYYKIGACTLNANFSPQDNDRLQQVIGYPASEVPVVFIAIGNPADEFMIPKSRRLELQNILEYY